MTRPAISTPLPVGGGVLFQLRMKVFFFLGTIEEPGGRAATGWSIQFDAREPFCDPAKFS